LHGTRGLEAQRVQNAELVQARAAYASIDAQRAIWETKIATLSGKSVARDMLDGESPAGSQPGEPCRFGGAATFRASS
jgi:cell division protein FtsB